MLSVLLAAYVALANIQKHAIDRKVRVNNLLEWNVTELKRNVP
ncbi:hypothetical protein [Vibrio barjaei]|jgi:hypothetical protein|uniref:Uncharacterized protein n=1 Tax=Vibrio barjaei TaxID=1676683 RepID=A0ABW7IN34_9VIBR|nr:hypothetical protein [Vibrio barjaei]MCY9872431.1 hypothetical protein [Vibrio barjaei]